MPLMWCAPAWCNFTTCKYAEYLCCFMWIKDGWLKFEDSRRDARWSRHLLWRRVANSLNSRQTDRWTDDTICIAAFSIIRPISLLAAVACRCVPAIYFFVFLAERWSAHCTCGVSYVRMCDVYGSQYARDIICIKSWNTLVLNKYLIAII